MIAMRWVLPNKVGLVQGEGCKEIYSYSKTKGLFAGVSLSGTKWEIDYDANKSVYGTVPSLPSGGDSKSVQTLLGTDGSGAPGALRPFLESLDKNVGEGKES